MLLLVLPQTARAAGVRVLMVHVSDPDVWFRTTYADVAKYAADEVIFLPLYYSSGSATTVFRHGVTGPTAVLPTQPVTTWNMHEWDID